VCTIKYMIRKMWGGFVEGLPWCGLLVLSTFVCVGAVYAFEAVAGWLGIDPELLGALCLLALIPIGAICGLVGLYREARRHCATEDGPACEHEFFKCQVPPGTGGGAIYHWVCKKCRWDESKKVFMPDEIWYGWAVPQLEEKRRAKC